MQVFSSCSSGARCHEAGPPGSPSLGRAQLEQTTSAEPDADGEHFGAADGVRTLAGASTTLGGASTDAIRDVDHAGKQIGAALRESGMEILSIRIS